MTFHSVISGQNTLIGRNPLLPVTHVRIPPFQGNPLRGRVTFDDVTSGSHVGHTQWYILYYYHSKKKTREPVAQSILPVMWLPVPVTWLPVKSFPVKAASGDVTSGSSSNATLAVLIYYLYWRYIWNTAILVIMYVEISKTDDILLIGNVMVCLMSHWPINIYYCWFVLRERNFWSNIASKVKLEMGDAIRSPF